MEGRMRVSGLSVEEVREGDGWKDRCLERDGRCGGWKGWRWVDGRRNQVEEDGQEVGT